MADTGIRVPFNTQAPLILPGTLSTTEHCDQRLSDKEYVEHRRESRLKDDQAVMVTALGLMLMPPIAARVLDISGSGLRLRLPNPLPCGSPVKVETESLVMTGEVARCEQSGEGYIAGLRIMNTSTVTVAKKESRVIIET